MLDAQKIALNTIILIFAFKIIVPFIALVCPSLLMAPLGFSLPDNLQGTYLVRLWAARDIVMAILALYFLNIKEMKAFFALVLAWVVVDSIDVISACLAYSSGYFDAKSTLMLISMALSGLIPEAIAGYILWRKSKNSRPAN